MVREREEKGKVEGEGVREENARSLLPLVHGSLDVIKPRRKTVPLIVDFFFLLRVCKV